ncbi:unnamed protein product [Rotaria sp. Silwood2]|nr:unnamed protein product [Rotaria sp. Silwood2]
MTTVEDVTSLSSNTVNHTVLFHTTTSTVTEISTTIDNNWKTSQNQLQSTTEYINEETTSSTFSFSRTQTSTEASSNTLKDSQTISETNLDLSSDSITVPFTVQDTTRLQFSTTDSSLLDNSNIDTTISNSSPDRFSSTLNLINEISSTTMSISNSDQTSIPTAVLLNNVSSTINTTLSTDTKLNSFQETSALSSESGLLRTFEATSIQSFATTESVLTSIENQLGSSRDDLFHQSSTMLSIVSRSNSVSSTSDMITRDIISTTETSMNAQSSEVIASSETQSTTVSILSKETDTIIDLSTMTSITPLNSTHFTSQSADNSTSLVSQDEAYIETTTSSINNSILSSGLYSSTEDVSVTKISIMESSQNNPEIETSLSNIGQSTSSFEYSLDHSASSEASELTNEKTDSYTVSPTLSTTFNQSSNQVTEQETLSMSSLISASSTDQTSLLLFSDTSPVVHINSTTSISAFEISTSNISHSTTAASDVSTSEDSTNASKDQVLISQASSLINDRETTSSAYIDQQIISSSQTHSDSITDKITGVIETISSSQIPTNDLLSLQLSTTTFSQTDLSSSTTQKSVSNDITSSTHTSSIDSLVETTPSIDNGKSIFTSLSTTELLSDFTNTISSDVTELINSSLILSSPSLSDDTITTTNIKQTDNFNQLPTTLSSSSDYTSLKDVISTETTSKNFDKSFSSIQSTLISHNQTSTIQTEYNSSMIKSSTESINITSISP